MSVNMDLLSPFVLHEGHCKSLQWRHPRSKDSLSRYPCINNQSSIQILNKLQMNSSLKSIFLLPRRQGGIFETENKILNHFLRLPLRQVHSQTYPHDH